MEWIICYFFHIFFNLSLSSLSKRENDFEIYCWVIFFIFHFFKVSFDAIEISKTRSFLNASTIQLWLYYLSGRIRNHQRVPNIFQLIIRNRFGQNLEAVNYFKRFSNFKKMLSKIFGWGLIELAFVRQKTFKCWKILILFYCYSMKIWVFLWLTVEFGIFSVLCQAKYIESVFYLKVKNIIINETCQK